jgi:sensor domain CHASE-containing protein
MAIGMIIGSVFWLTERIDRLERENGTKIVQLMVTQKVNKLAASVADYAYWDKGYAYVVSQHHAEIDAEIGSAASADGIFSHVMILDSSGTPLAMLTNRDVRTKSTSARCNRF